MTSQSNLVALAVHNLTRSHGAGAARVEVLRGIDLRVEAGELVAIMGPSGSGKSTLLHLIAGLDSPTAGSIFVDGQDLTTLSDDQRTLLRRRHIGLVFQHFQLLDMMTAEENVALPLVIAGTPRRKARARAAESLGEVGLAHRRTHLPGELSGGEQQRVAIARALIIEPVLLLADEPTGNLDSVSGAQVLDLLRRLGDQRRRAIVLVTHDPAQAQVADRVVVLRDGRNVPSLPETSRAGHAA